MRLRIQPWLFCAPLLVGVALVFLCPLVVAVPLQLPAGRVGVHRRASSSASRTSGSSTRTRCSGGRSPTTRTLLLCVPILIVLSASSRRCSSIEVRGWRAYRTFVFLPYMLSIPVVGIVFGYLFQQNGLSTARSDRRPRRAPQDWLGSVDLGDLDDHGRHRLEGARVRGDRLPRPADLRSARSCSRRRGSTAPAGGARSGTSSSRSSRRRSSSTRSSRRSRCSRGSSPTST